MNTAPITPIRSAAVVDIENLMITCEGQRVTNGQAQLIIDAVQIRTAGLPTRVASSRNIVSAFMPLLAGQSWGVSLVDTTVDAADNALLATAREFVAAGVTDLVVASGDHAFAELASQVRLHVISHADHLSNQLVAAATTVTRLRLPAADFRLAA